MPTPDDPRPPWRLSAPLAAPAVAMAFGVIVDRFSGLDWPTPAWAIVALIAGLFALARRAPILLLVAFAALGGARHHRHWFDLASDDLARGDWSTPRPAWLRGSIVDGPQHVPDTMIGQDDGSTRILLDVSSISDGEAWHTASGRIQVYISGDRSDLKCGGPVFAAGSLSEIHGPMNPGEADRRERARSEGIRLRLSVNDSVSVWVDPEGHTDQVARWIGWARARSQSLLVDGLPPDVSALASALLLGRREAVDPDLNDAFARTGTTHLLAISGLHLQALASAMFFLMLLFRVEWKRAYVLVGLATIAYGILVGFSPSVMRSVAMTLLVCAAGKCDACPSLANCLAFAAIGTMIANPSSLFDAGCQLSFLAVMGLFWAVPLVMPRPKPIVPDDFTTPKGRLDALERRLEPKWKARLRRFGRGLLEGLIASAVIWVLSIPLVAFRFHLMSPIGVLLNLPLIPITTLALFCAGITLAASLVWAPLAWPSGWACGWLLRLTMKVVNWGASAPYGWSFTPGPSMIGTLVFYGLLALAGWSTYRAWKVRKLIWAGLGIEGAILAVMVMLPPLPGRPEALVLAVDHGLSVILQGTDGRVTLYDCGKMRDPRMGRRIVAPALWSRGVSRIDTVVLSHADSDHYNGLDDLLARFKIGEVCIPPDFGGEKNPEAVRLLDAIRSRKIPIRDIVRGDTLPLSGGSIAVLHPPRDWGHGQPDNARSVVLNVSAPGESGFLLTGDLEGAGLAEMANRPRPDADTMLSPHHGGRSANPAWFYAWAVPKRVIASQRRPTTSGRDALAPLSEKGVIVDRTWKTGAISMTLGSPAASAAQPIIAAVRPIGPRAALTILGGAAGLAVVVALAVMEWGAWTLVMPGRRLAHGSPEPEPWEPIDVLAKDGARLHGARLRNHDSIHLGTFAFLHGFGEDRAAMLGRAQAMHRRGWTVAVLDTRGRGRSEGDKTAFGGREADDLHAWLDVLSEGRKPVIAWGRSMGAAIAARAAVEDDRISAVVLEAPYADLRDAVGAWIARMHVPRFLAAPILWRAEHLAGVSLHEPRPIDVAPKVNVPVLILHGSLDPVAPPEAVRKLANAFGDGVKVIEVEGARHGDVLDRGGVALIERVADWVAQSTRNRSDAGTSGP